MKTVEKTSVRRTFRIVAIVVGFLLVFLVVEGGILRKVCTQGTADTKGLVNEGLPSLRHLAAIQENLVLFRLYSYELMFAQEQSRPAKMAQADALEKTNRELLAELNRLFPAGVGHDRVAQLESSLNAYISANNRLRGQLDKDFQLAMQILDKEIPALVAHLDESANALKTYCEDFAQLRARQTVDGFASIQTAASELGSANVLCALFVLVLVLISAQRLHKTLFALTQNLSDASQQVTGSSASVATASQALAEGASGQAASLQESSSSLEELSSMTQQNAANARKAKELATQARQAADAGTSDMQRMNAAMDAIKNSSNDIAKIIKTIDEIAFQTNILALNAAVEAARAGEAGMGFAVVAEEVRNLAQRSAHAAKETSSKIENAITNSGQGVQISEKVAGTLQEIVGKVRMVDELIAEVAAASKEQSEGIGQINAAVAQMDSLTQSNAANAEESASAAQELDAQASNLEGIVSDLAAMVGGLQRKALQIEPARGHSVSKSRVKAPISKPPIRSIASPRPAPLEAANVNGNSLGVGQIPLDGDFQ